MLLTLLILGLELLDLITDLLLDITLYLINLL